MDDEIPPLIADQPVDPAKRSLVDDIRQVVNDGRILVEAEVAYQKSRAAVAGSGAKGVLGWGALTVAVLFFALMALVVGALLIASIYIGPVLATVSVVLGLLVIALVAALAARSRWNSTARLLADQDKGQ